MDIRGACSHPGCVIPAWRGRPFCRSHDPETPRCQGTTAAGEPCRAHARNDSQFCGYHDPQGPRRELRERSREKRQRHYAADRNRLHIHVCTLLGLARENQGREVVMGRDAEGKVSWLVVAAQGELAERLAEFLEETER